MSCKTCMTELCLKYVRTGIPLPPTLMRISSPLSALATIAAFIVLLLPIIANAFGIQVMVNGQTVVFADVSQSAWFATYVRDAAEAGIVNGYMDANGKLTGRFGPENSVTFSEALKIAEESAGYDEQAFGTVVASGVNHWSSPYVSVAKAENFEILNHPYRLDRPATRAEVASMMTSAFGVTVPATPSGTTFRDVQLSTAFAMSIEALARDGVVSGDTDVNGQVTGTFRPTATINRAEVVKIAMGARGVYGEPGKDRVPEQPSSAENTVVTYRDNGFSPTVLTVPLGTTVTFKNGSSGSLWVASNPHPTHTDYPGFDSTTVIPAGQEFSFKFNQRGTWGYHNHLRSPEGGTIVVE